MRCQDCGQQFTRWEAFKTHLRMHVLEEEEENRRQTAKRPAAATNGTSNTTAEPALPEKRRRTTTTKVKEEEEEEEEEGEEEQQEGGAGSSEDSDVDVDGVDERQDVDGDIFDCAWQVKPSEIVRVRPRVAMLSAEEKPVFSSSTRVYACSVCGKVYSYLESFRNHQKMHEQEALAAKRRPLDHKCDHPGCSKAFARAGHLVIHRRAHRRTPTASPQELLRCDQCNKTFNSPQTWMIHAELHKQKPYWCLACAKGFKDEVSLDKHLQGHDLRKHKCDICHKSFRVPAELKYHYNTHTGAKPYKCNLCKKDFSQMGNLLTHRKKHVGVYLGASKTPLGSKNHSSTRRRVEEMKRLVVTGSGNPKMLMTSQHRHAEEEEDEGNESGSEEIAAEKVPASGPEESGSSTSGSSGSDGSTSESSKSSSSGSSSESESDSSDSSGSEMEKTRGEEEKEEEDYDEEQQPEHMAQTAGVVESECSRHRGEWECFECDVAFDHQSELHMHYMKHASGELSVQ